MEKLFTSDAERKGAFVHYELRDARTKALITELTDYAARTKELRLPRTKVGDFTLKTTRRAGTLFIDIQSKTLLKDAYIDLGETGWQLSDNFLDILPGRRYRLRATRRQNAPVRTTTALLHHDGGVARTFPLNPLSEEACRRVGPACHDAQAGPLLRRSAARQRLLCGRARRVACIL